MVIYFIFWLYNLYRLILNKALCDYIFLYEFYENYKILFLWRSDFQNLFLEKCAKKKCKALLIAWKFNNFTTSDQ